MRKPAWEKKRNRTNSWSIYGDATICTTEAIVIHPIPAESILLHFVPLDVVFHLVPPIQPMPYYISCVLGESDRNYRNHCTAFELFISSPSIMCLPKPDIDLTAFSGQILGAFLIASEPATLLFRTLFFFFLCVDIFCVSEIMAAISATLVTCFLYDKSQSNNFFSLERTHHFFLSCIIVLLLHVQ